MVTYTLPYIPLQSGYEVNESSDEVIFTQLDGGAPRMRRDILGGWKTVIVQWVLDPEQFAELSRFYRIVGKHLAESFYASLIIDQGALKQYEACFVPSSFRLSAVQGLFYTVSARLYVKPELYDDDYDASVLLMCSLYGCPDGAEEVLNLLEQLVNVDLYAALRRVG